MVVIEFSILTMHILLSCCHIDEIIQQYQGCCASFLQCFCSWLTFELGVDWLHYSLIRSSKWFTIDWAMFVSYFLGESQLQLVCDSLKRKIWFSSAFLWEVCCKERKEIGDVWWISYHANVSNGLWILPEHWLPPHLLLKIYESALLQ